MNKWFRQNLKIFGFSLYLTTFFLLILFGIYPIILIELPFAIFVPYILLAIGIILWIIGMYSDYKQKKKKIEV